MKNVKLFLVLFCSILLVALSCKREELVNVNVTENKPQVNSNPYTKARIYIDKKFLDFNYSKYNISPLWELAIINPNKKSVEVPYTLTTKLPIPNVKNQDTKIEGRQRLLVQINGAEVSVSIITYIPTTSNVEKIQNINSGNFKQKKFTGRIIFQKLGEEEKFIWSLDNGKVTKKSYVRKKISKNLRPNDYWGCTTYAQDTDWYQWNPYTEEWMYTNTTTEIYEVCEYIIENNNPPPYDPYDCNNNNSWPWCNNGNGGGSNFGDNAASPGQKPIAEYVNDKCGGAVGMWNMGLQNNNHEVYGVLTQDGSLLITQISPNSIGGNFDGLYSHNGTTYYWYPSNGNPTPQYTGTITSGNRYYIPISATVHTHTPCVNDGTDGITGKDGADDFPFAGQFNGINHFVLGCNGGAAQYNSNSYFNHQTGNHSSTCNIIH